MLGRQPLDFELKLYEVATLRTDEDHLEGEEKTSTETTQARAPFFTQRYPLLRRHVHEALNNANDDELREVLRERYLSIPRAQRLSQMQVVELAIRFLDLAHLRLDARLAVIYLAHADWNYPAAVERYMTERCDEPDSAGASN